ncbi:MAG: cytochrome o ubiquinol oxidase subunit IV [Candidatus Nomurabacteria bacterium]|nr:MAG: cytochrome o ubiquinol oxidase subunit IV [Candidatus Nomurabacteria bacterium]
MRTRYVAGYVLSLILTLLAYDAVVNHFTYGFQLLLLLGVLAVIQAVVQLVFFLHIDQESGPRYKLITFLVMIVMLLIVVVGSFWIMYHLNYNMMQLSPDAKTNLMLNKYDKGGF